MAELTTAQLNNFADEMSLSARKIQDNATSLADASNLISSAIQCGGLSERLRKEVGDIATSLEEVGSDMTRVSTQVREAADLQKNRELLGL